MKEKLKNIFVLFAIFLKIGLFTFGGGYAMIGIIQEQVVDKKKWISQEDFFEILVIAESTPGPIAVNMATYIGYKVAGIVGSIFATIGLAIPSMVIIYIISLFYQEFLQLEFVKSIFAGLKVGVIVLLINTVLKLMKSMEKTPTFYIILTIALAVMLAFKIWIPGFSWISLILIACGLIFGVINTALSNKFKLEGRSKK